MTLGSSMKTGWKGLVSASEVMLCILEAVTEEDLNRTLNRITAATNERRQAEIMMAEVTEGAVRELQQLTNTIKHYPSDVRR